MKLNQWMAILGILTVPSFLGSFPSLIPYAQAAENVAPSVDQDAMQKVLNHYSKIQQSLAADRLGGVKDDAALMIPPARGIKDKKLSDQIQKIARNLMAASGGTSGHGTLSQARDEFKKLSGPISDWVKKNKPEGWNVIHCPMAGASWVQKAGTSTENPFYGKEMLSCGEKVS